MRPGRGKLGPFSLPQCLAILIVGMGFAVSHTSIADAGELHVLTSGAFRPVVAALAVPYEAKSGNKVVIENDTAGALIKKVQGGAAFDLIVLTPDGLATLAKSGLVAADTQVRLAKVGIGVAVKDGAPKPDISTTAAFKQALIDAPKIAVIDPAAGGSSGIYLAKLFERMGIGDQLKPKLVLVHGGLVATRLLDGEATLAVHQTSELLAVKGVTLAGPLPDEIQSYTIYAGAVSAHVDQPEAARDFLKVLAGPQASTILKSDGMLPPD
jgi:molybdate transport system substrate-binding protein